MRFNLFRFTTLHADMEDFVTHLLSTWKTLMINFQAHQIQTPLGLSSVSSLLALGKKKPKQKTEACKIQLENIKNCSIFLIKTHGLGEMTLSTQSMCWISSCLLSYEVTITQWINLQTLF